MDIKVETVAKVMRKNIVKAMLHITDHAERMRSNVNLYDEGVSNPTYLREQASKLASQACALMGCCTVLSALSEALAENGTGESPSDLIRRAHFEGD